MMRRAGVWWVWAAMATGCAEAEVVDKAVDTDTDVVAATDTTADTDVVDTDVSVATCDGADACTGCMPAGDSFTCDCAVEVADDAATCRPIRVVILDDRSSDDADPSSGSYIEPILNAATWTPGVPMFTVLNVGYRATWDGTHAVPEPADTDTDADTDAPAAPLVSTDTTDVVFLLEGVDYSSSLTEAGESVVTDFLNAGGGLVRGEWGTSYQELYPGWSPVEPYDAYIESVAPKSWKLGASTEPVAKLVQAGLPATFTMQHSIVETSATVAVGSTDVDAKVALEVLYDEPDAYVPGVAWLPSTYRASSTGTGMHGTILWINSDFAYLSTPPTFETMQEPEFATLIHNMARAAASGL